MGWRPGDNIRKRRDAAELAANTNEQGVDMRIYDQDPSLWGGQPNPDRDLSHLEDGIYGKNNEEYNPGSLLSWIFGINKKLEDLGTDTGDKRTLPPELSAGKWEGLLQYIQGLGSDAEENPKEAYKFDPLGSNAAEKYRTKARYKYPNKPMNLF